MTQLFCNIPSLATSLAYRLRDSRDAKEIFRAVSDRISGIRLPAYRMEDRPAFDVVEEIEIDAQIRDTSVAIRFGGAISSHRYETDLETFHWDFWKISIAVLSKALLVRGIVIAHAACIASSDICYLLPGTSGAGKSSLSFYARSCGASVYASELAFIGGAGLVAGNSLMSIDDAALQVMRIPRPADARLDDGKVTLHADPLDIRPSALRLVFPRISPSSAYFERTISARRSRMLLFENIIGQLGISQLIDGQRVPVRSLPTHAEIDTIMEIVNRVASQESLICEGQPAAVWTRLERR